MAGTRSRQSRTPPEIPPQRHKAWRLVGITAANRFTRCRCCQVSLAVRGLSCCKTITAIHGPVIPRLEWDLSDPAALAARCSKHFALTTNARAARVPAVPALRLTGSTTVGTAARFVRESLRCEELLLSAPKSKGCAAVNAIKDLVSIHKLNSLVRKSAQKTHFANRNQELKTNQEPSGPQNEGRSSNASDVTASDSVTL